VIIRSSAMVVVIDAVEGVVKDHLSPITMAVSAAVITCC
jgi:hypothetical protein